MTADEMFKELGYILNAEDKRIVIYSLIKYFTNFKTLNEVYFYKTDNRIVLRAYNLTDNIKIDFFLTTEELKAINKKIEELGW